MENTTNEILQALRKLVEDIDNKQYKPEPEKKTEPKPVQHKYVTIKYDADDPKSAVIMRKSSDAEVEPDEGLAITAALAKEVSSGSGWEVTHSEICKTITRCALADIFVGLLTGGDKDD